MLNNTACNNLDEQGYTFLSVEEKSKLNIAFRITPTLCILVVIFGLMKQDWRVFAGLSVFGILGAATTKYQPFDVLYNVVLRHVLKSPKLPPSPVQKRFACALGAAFLIGAAISFHAHAFGLGDFFGAGYIIAAGLMATTHWCVGSWMYNRMFKRVA